MQRLSQDGVGSLVGIQRMLDLEKQVQALGARVAELDGELDDLKSVFGAGSRVFAAGLAGEVVAVRAGQRPTRSINPSQAVVVWRPRR